LKPEKDDCDPPCEEGAPRRLLSLGLKGTANVCPNEGRAEDEDELVFGEPVAVSVVKGSCSVGTGTADAEENVGITG